MTLDTANTSALLSTIVDPQVKSLFEKIIDELNTNVSGDTTVSSDLDTAEATIDDLETMLTAVLSGDIALSVTPATLGSSAATINAGIAGDGFSREVDCAVVDGSGNVLTYFNGSLPVAVSVSTNGTEAANIGGASSLTFVDGEASITINYTGTWVAADTCTLTLGSTSSIAGKTVADDTSIDTVVA